MNKIKLNTTKLLAIFILSFSFSACHKPMLDPLDLAAGFKEVDGNVLEETILQGNHLVNLVTDVLGTEQIRGSSFKIRFSIHNPAYEFVNDPTYQLAWNKVTGFSDCDSLNAFKGYGALLAWRWNITLKKIQLAAYVHNKDGDISDASYHVKTFQNFTLGPDDVAELTIALNSGANGYIYTLSNPNTAGTQTISMENSNVPDDNHNLDNGRGDGCGAGPISGRRIHFFFGGKIEAPHNITLRYQLIKN